PSTSDLTRQLGSSDGQVEAALRRLHTARHLVLNGDGSILMAHPFTAVPLGFAVMGRKTLWWGGWALDSFGLLHFLAAEPEALVATRCPGCGAPHAWVVGRDQPPRGTQVAHFLIPAARMWEDVVCTCSNQQIYCSEECVNAWLSRTGNTHGD